MVEIIPKPAEKPPFWQNLILIPSIIILLVAIFAYFILSSLQTKAQQDIKDLDGKISQTKTKERQDLENHLLREKKIIDDFSLILSKHRISSSLFVLLEKATHPKVWFDDFKLDFSKGTITLSGKTESFITLGQQETIFQTIGEIAKTTTGQEILNTKISKIAIGKEGEVEFSLDLLFGSQNLK